MSATLSDHKLLIANRGEIAVRVLRTARKLGIPTVAVYTRTDATVPHVALADEAVALLPDVSNAPANARGYTDASALLGAARAYGVTLVHPGYGFLSEDAAFAREVELSGITWLGPSADVIGTMGLKHEARKVAVRARVPVVPGSEGLVVDVEGAVEVAARVGYPIIIKSTAGGGGMGLVVCADEDEVREKFVATQERAKSLFNDTGVFLERYFPAARHIEIQIFGNGVNHVMHMGERECSIQRRYQKIIEETPSPFLETHPGLREKMCGAAIRLCEEIGYSSAGTVEFIVDDTTGEFFFLEMNTRIQVEHTITEAARPGLDIVELQILQGIAQRSTHPTTLPPPLLTHPLACPPPSLHAIQARAYAENPSAGYAPCPGVLTHVAFPEHEWLRVDTWVGRGTEVTPFFDALVAKIVVSGADRTEAVRRLEEVLAETRLYGPPTNIPLLRAVVESSPFKSGETTTSFLSTFEFTPRAIDILAPGLATTVQALPRRTYLRGVPPSGPLDALAHRTANFLLGNAPTAPALEITASGPRIRFCSATQIVLAGGRVDATIDGERVDMWDRVRVKAGQMLDVGVVKEGWGCVLAVEGGFDVGEVLGSAGTSVGFGGYQGRALRAGDHIPLCPPKALNDNGPVALPRSLIPTYPREQTLYVLPGPHADETFLTPSGIATFYTTHWLVEPASNRMGIRLAGPPLEWVQRGGEGGAHGSNVLDAAYARGAVNVNGDTPVMLGPEGPDMGGYACVCVVASADMWKLGQLRPGDKIKFVRVNWEQAMQMRVWEEEYFTQVEREDGTPPKLFDVRFEDTPYDPRLNIVEAEERPSAVFRQAGDAAILLEYGEVNLDLHLRARVHAFERALEARAVHGIVGMAPCIRSTMIHYEPTLISQRALLEILVAVDAALPASTHAMAFPGRRLTLPLVLDDRWSRAALERYARTTRDEAAYLPSNVEYLARANGLESAQEALRLLASTDWLVFGVGFYLACPFLVPIDPRARLTAQKMNPSRTYTPRGAVGIAGPVAAIYPIESPGGYQLFGRSLPPWRTWAREPGVLRPFDQVRFKVVEEREYEELERRFDAGQYVFEEEEVTFSMEAYDAFIKDVKDETAAFRTRQKAAMAREDAREMVLLEKWRTRKEAEARKEAADTAASVLDEATAGNGHMAVSPLTATVWKVLCKPGDVVRAAAEVLVVLEAMKTEVNVTAGADNVGRTVRGYGRDVRQGGLVQAGDVLVVLE